ncbi:DUF6603 domain-containing protein [Granulosicoccus antarcticus]|uniref:DUF6603 domain-containing protein n=1 Tax=Granulosicoccus antarcticus IMCC3135 TaxID=1192854 RepID=A0A2Z2NTL2_9GAMM|nr:DUF6603 domain-containing protein [Granulosicoccus antarcticus]ASJ72090.1 hypothetical protein IMCC3135_09980 [Granulosicoccus antarcticus IMCC3135]
MSDIGENDILRELVQFFAPVAIVTQRPDKPLRWFNVTTEMMEDMPHDPAAEMTSLLVATGLELREHLDDITSATADLVAAGQALWTVLDALNKGQSPDLQRGLTAIRSALTSVTDGIGSVGGLPPPNEIAAALLEHLTVRYLRDRAPAIWHGCCLLGIGNEDAVRKQNRGQFDAAKIWPAISSPQTALAQTISWNTGLDAELLFAHLEGLAAEFGLTTRMIESPQHSFAAIPPDADLAALTAELPLPDDALGDTVELSLTAVIAELAADGPTKPGILALLRMQGDAGKVLDLDAGWQAEFSSDFSGNLPFGLIARPGGLSFEATAASDAVAAKASITIKQSPPQYKERIALGPLAINAARPVFRSIFQTGKTQSLSIEATLEDAKVIIAPTDPDGFIGKLVPKPLETQISLTLGYDVKTGFYLQRGGGLGVEIPAGLSIGTIVTILSVGMALDAAEGTEAARQTLALVLSGKAKLGPLGVTIEGIGVNLEGGLPTSLADVSALVVKFKQPSGLGLTLEAGPVKGGGYIAFNADTGQYVGTLSLNVAELGLSAFGMLDTKMLDGADGYSLLVTVAGRFSPVPLGFGFTLSSVGGLLGLHRDVNIDVLKQAVRAGTAGDILSPKDPIGDAPRIAKLASGMFPITRGQHVFGPSVKLGWGQPKELVSLDLALALTLPDPLRLVLIGKVAVAVPDPKIALVKLNMNVFGVIDFTARTLEAEGALFDSQVQGLPVKGGFAVLTRWGGMPTLAFSVGGLHPAFERPAGFPDVPRLGVDLSTKGMTLLLEGYFAITSNSIQLGARAMLKAGAAGFTLTGELGFDALVIFEPFGLDLEIYASASIRRGSTNLCSVSVRGRLRGPGPWIVNGEATIEILFFDITAKFSKTIGQEQSTPLSTVRAREILYAALGDPRNWSGESDQGDAIMDHADGLVPPGAQLSVDQKLIPLDLDLATVGANPIEGPHRFGITGLQLGQSRLEVAETLRAPFARAQFLAVSDAQKLSGPSYEALPSGARFGQGNSDNTGSTARVDAGRACFIVQPADETTGESRRVRLSIATPRAPDASRMPTAPTAQGRISIESETWTHADNDLNAGGPATSHTEASASAASENSTVARTTEVAA